MSRPRPVWHLRGESRVIFECRLSKVSAFFPLGTFGCRFGILPVHRLVYDDYLPELRGRWVVIRLNISIPRGSYMRNLFPIRISFSTITLSCGICSLRLSGCMRTAWMIM